MNIITYMNGIWKFRLISFLKSFQKLSHNKEAIYREAMSMLSDVAEVKVLERNDKEKLERNMKQLDELHKQMANLVDMCADGDISREVFRSKKKKLEDQISNIEKINGECRQQILGKLSENPRLFNCRDESVTKLDHIFPNIWLYFLVFVLHYMNEREINTLQNFCM